MRTGTAIKYALYFVLITVAIVAIVLAVIFAADIRAKLGTGIGLIATCALVAGPVWVIGYVGERLGQQIRDDRQN